MLRILGYDTLEELEDVFNQLIDIKVDITEEEIIDYSEQFISNKGKLKIIRKK